MRRLISSLMAGAAQVARADAIPYPSSGIVNPVTYTFTAAANGNITAYFAGDALTPTINLWAPLSGGGDAIEQIIKLSSATIVGMRLAPISNSLSTVNITRPIRRSR